MEINSIKYSSLILKLKLVFANVTLTTIIKLIHLLRLVIRSVRVINLIYSQTLIIDNNYTKITGNV